MFLEDDIFFRVKMLLRWDKIMCGKYFDSLITKCNCCPKSHQILYASRTVSRLLLQLFEQLAVGLAGGKSIVDPMKDAKVFPAMVIQMVGVGEKTGQLGAMLLKVADFYDEEVDAAIDALTSMMEPLIMVVLGGAVGFLMIAMYMPMFSMSDAIKG